MKTNQDAGVELAWDPGYDTLKQYLIAATGMAYYRDRDPDLASLISQRLAELGMDGCCAYLDFLAAGPGGRAEWDILVEQLTIGETYFFRDRQQFDAIRDVILPEILDRKRASKRLRVWSAGCSTGAEPYSLAILLGREMAQQTDGWQISILATDINRQFLAEAAEGKFREWAFRSTDAATKQQCFSRSGESWEIQPEYKRLVQFTHFNLVDKEFPSARDDIANFDLILCRNVMIYFARETTRRLIRQFHESLSSEGWFLVGAAEPNLESFTTFHLVNAAGTTLYQKSVANPRSAVAVKEPPPLAAAFPEEPPVSWGAAPALQLKDNGVDVRAASAPESVAHGELEPGVYFFHALLQEQLGNFPEAERLLRQAIYLNRGFALAHYHLGLHLKRMNRLALARRSFANVLRLLDGRSGDACLLHGDSTTVASLAALSRRHLADLGPV